MKIILIVAAALALLALLVVPFGAGEQTFVARFDPADGQLVLLESMRSKDSKSAAKTLWLNESSNWRTVAGAEIPATGAVTWFDQGKPWAVFTIEDVVLNADIGRLSKKAANDVGGRWCSTAASKM